MSKLRVYQVAKDFNVSSEALIGILVGLGISARSHMSTVEPADVERIRKKFSEEKARVQQEDLDKEAAKKVRIVETFSASHLSLFIDLDEFTPEYIAEFLSDLSDMYRDLGGDRLIIRRSDLLDMAHASVEV